ncbi:YdcF family protein [Bombilactobacillus thymidiniphilus]|uniref:YdcF family protein n=1 Tax=Bombilactobacillus thymidiniphilus TaxID=2923363 RepID=UPI0037BF3597
MNISYIIWLWISVLVIFIILAISFHQNKFRLINGALVNLLLAITAVAGILTVEASKIQWLYQLVYWILVIISVPILVLYSSLGLLLLWNASIVWRRESHSLTNELTLLLGLGVLLLPMLRLISKKLFPDLGLNLYTHLLLPIIFYVLFWLLAFITSFLITRLYKPKYNQEYIIVLGAGLLNGTEISPLLASRLDIALEFANKQIQKNGYSPIIICSGGQGSDESLPEGQAMRAYLLEHSSLPQQVYSETRSKNTYENFKFSKAILEKLHLNLQQGIFATSDYHTFRAASYARSVGLFINGIGAQTSKFFIPNAFLREYVALLANHKKFHVICLSFILLVSIFDLFALLTQ